MRLLTYVLTFRWANRLSDLAGILSAAALVLATLAMVHGVLSRYLFGRPTVWQTEVSIYLLIFATFVGAAYGLKHHAHVGVDLIVERLPPRARLTARVVTAVLALGVVAVAFWTSTFTWWEAYEGGHRSPTALRAPLSVVYAILPAGMLLVAFQYLAMTIEGVQALLGRRELDGDVSLLRQGNPELSDVRAATASEPVPSGSQPTAAPASSGSAGSTEKGPHS